ncbi:MAG TPA: hypothetical protein VFW52_00825 [Candidatus Saccharimonadales bacterium]|nr:hypothetical protein [Candidatus Saccharimonadales bacterium]
MEAPKKYLHDRVVLLLLTVMAILLVIGVSLVLMRFDPSRNPTTTIAYRPSVTGTQYQSGKPLDIYLMAAFMIIIAGTALILSLQTHPIRRFLSVFILSSTIFLLAMAIIVSNALISLQ